MPASRPSRPMEFPQHVVRSSCRACRGADLVAFLDLGRVALANAFLADRDDPARERRYPLEVSLCRSCGLVQLRDVVAPEVLFGHYLYVTGTSETIAEHNRRYAREVVAALELGPEDLIVEVASNDGSLLARFQERGVRVLGIEPARNLAELANGRGIPTSCRFFGREAADEACAAHGRARAVIGNNVLAHVDDPVAFLDAARRMLAPRGRVIFEVPELAEMVERLEYDTIYHEHLSYFSVAALCRVCEEAGLAIERVESQAVHGGTIRVTAAPREEQAQHAASVLARAERERAAGLCSLERLQLFASDVERQRAALLELLRSWKSSGARVAGYGAPAKGNTLLNYCGITTDLLPYTVDRNPLKVGLRTPGQHIPVLPVETLLERRPDHVLILAWNFADEVVRQQARLAQLGTQFWLPVPMPQPWRAQRDPVVR